MSNIFLCSRVGVSFKAKTWDKSSLTCPKGSRWLFVNLSFWKDTSCRIQCAPVAGESGWTYSLPGMAGSAFPVTDLSHSAKHTHLHHCNFPPNFYTIFYISYLWLYCSQVWDSLHLSHALISTRMISLKLKDVLFPEHVFALLKLKLVKMWFSLHLSCITALCIVHNVFQRPVYLVNG